MDLRIAVTEDQGNSFTSFNHIKKNTQATKMVSLFYLMVLILTIIQQTMSQAGNFATFGVEGEGKFTHAGDTLKMARTSKYVKWTLPKPIRAFGKNRSDILVSK